MQIPLRITQGPETWNLGVALFERLSATFTVNHKRQVAMTINSISHHEWKEWVLTGNLYVLTHGKDYAVRAVYSTETRTGDLTVEIDDPIFVRPSLRQILTSCPKCGGTTSETDKLFEGSAIWRCHKCIATCNYDDECTWMFEFTMDDKEDRAHGHRLSRCDDPHNHA